jgi:hypothetical protein
MYLIISDDSQGRGAFSIINDYDEKVILLFEDLDDAKRYVLMLREIDIDDLSIVSYEEEQLIKTCMIVGFKYAKIKKGDFVIPPGYCNADI